MGELINHVTSRLDGAVVPGSGPYSNANTQHLNRRTVVHDVESNTFRVGKKKRNNSPAVCLSKTSCRRGTRAIEILFVAAVCLSLPIETMATLGKSEQQIDEVAKVLHSENVETQSVHGYIVKTLSSHDLTVKEYVNPKTKIIFGVTWRGMRMPDLLLLLGFDPSAMSGPQVHRSLRYTRIQTQTIILEMGGRPGSYVGRGILIRSLPARTLASEVAP